MIDIKLIRENRDLVKENIKKKFQDEKLGLVDEVFELDKEVREAKLKGDNLRSEKNNLSKSIGLLIKEGKKDEAEEVKKKISDMDAQIKILEISEEKKNNLIKEKMMVIPNIIDESVPIGKDDSENVEVERFGEPVVPNYEIPYHADIINAVGGMDKESAGRTSGEGFYYLLGDIARLHEAMIAYARDYMINKGFKALKTIRLIRTFRVLRIFKSFRYSKNIQIVLQVGKNSKKALIAVLYLAIGYIFVCALIIFNVEPDSFNTFFDAIYWATISLTTVGYGDIYPITTLGRIITMVSSFMGIAIVALPAGIITAGYMKEIESDKI